MHAAIRTTDRAAMVAGLCYDIRGKLRSLLRELLPAR
ncbi:hypothetical protein BC739_004343 [Kutzneria viridogrisea]|uniref:Uncharacterized protein n=1 Tax=Kutzneria viridogrisea TaxID=47990 RepID=A0ABR6BJR1_9PSEU|nr:hypothetical protein [Kutzneria viridogrisea]